MVYKQLSVNNKCVCYKEMHTFCNTVIKPNQ